MKRFDDVQVGSRASALFVAFAMTDRESFYVV